MIRLPSSLPHLGHSNILPEPFKRSTQATTGVSTLICTGMTQQMNTGVNSQITSGMGPKMMTGVTTQSSSVVNQMATATTIQSSTGTITRTGTRVATLMTVRVAEPVYVGPDIRLFALPTLSPSPSPVSSPGVEQMVGGTGFESPKRTARIAPAAEVTTSGGARRRVWRRFRAAERPSRTRREGHWDLVAAETDVGLYIAFN
eukprot:468096_1